MRQRGSPVFMPRANRGCSESASRRGDRNGRPRAGWRRRQVWEDEIMSCRACGRDHADDGVLSRRHLIMLGAGLGLARFGGPPAAATARHPIDVHHPSLPPQYLREAPPAGYDLRRFAWAPEKSLEEMDQNGIGVAMLSFPTSFLWPSGVEPGRRLAR